MAYSVKSGKGYQLRTYDGKKTDGTYKVVTRTWIPADGLTAKQIKRELKAQLAQFEDDVKKGRKITGYSTFRELAEYWINNEGEEKLSPRTLERYKSLLSRVYESPIGDTKLVYIDQQDLNSFYRELKKPGANKNTGGSLSNKTIREHHNVISKILDIAWRWGVIDENIAKRADPPSIGYHEVECLNESEVETVFALLENEPIQYKTMISLLILFGFRRGELCGLEWKDIDFENRIIHIRRTSQYVNKQIITKEPKTERSRREVTIDSYSLQLLLEYKEWQDKKIQNCKFWNDTDRLFTAYNGKPIHPDTIGDWWDKFQKRNNLPKHTLHSLRHTNASLLISSDMDVVTVAGRLGHANSSTTLKVYSHMFKSRDLIAAEAMAKIANDSLKKAAAI